MPAQETVPRAIPTDKKRCEQLLRKLGYKGLTVVDIDTDRVYCLTAPVYHGEEVGWKKEPRTVTFEFPPVPDDEKPRVEHSFFTGWVV